MLLPARGLTGACCQRPDQGHCLRNRFGRRPVLILLVATVLSEPGITHLALPFGNLPGSVLTRNTVALLDFADELIAAPGDGGEVVVSQLSPIFFRSARNLLPMTFNTIPLHLHSPVYAFEVFTVSVNKVAGAACPELICRNTLCRVHSCSEQRRAGKINNPCVFSPLRSTV
jgi:hypothetical protein